MFETGTIIVALRTDEEVMLAVDRMITIQGEEPGSRIGPKLRQVGGCVFAVSNLNNYTATQFDAFIAAKKALRKRNTVERAMRRFDKRVSEPLHEALEDMREEYPDQFDKSFKNRIALGTIFVGVQQGTPVLGFIKFWSMIHEDELVLRRQYHYLETETRSVVLGRFGALVSNPVRFAPNQDPVEFLIDSIKLQMKADEKRGLKYIDWPIDVVRITKDGVVKWDLKQKPLDQAVSNDVEI